jgi:predicted cupin superfamily sugar epimerase
MYISLPMNAEAEQLISKLGLIPLPEEGGYFAQTWTSSSVGPGGRALGSAILFLITDTGFSALHRLGLEELWHFHAGDPVALTQIDPKADSLRTQLLGPDVTGGHVPQVLVPAGIWQGARLAPGGRRGWALLGCTLSPAWDQKEFELGQRETLLRDFPAHAGSILALTR